MAFWLELRCSKQLPGCFSHLNNGPMTLSMESGQAIAHNLAQLRKEAKEKGWIYTRDGHVCPACKVKS